MLLVWVQRGGRCFQSSGFKMVVRIQGVFKHTNSRDKRVLHGNNESLKRS